MKLSLLCFVVSAVALQAQQTEPPSNEELARRIDLLADMVSTPAETNADSPFSVGGYGEITYWNPEQANAEVDLHRVVLYLGYQFDPIWSFRSEIELEHSKKIEVEFAQIEAQLSDSMHFRMGNLLLPLGLTNQNHEPTSFYSSRRPLLERTILPTTWHENGVGLWAQQGNLHWQAYVMNGFDAANFQLASNGLRDGRQGGSQAQAENWAFSGRLDWQIQPNMMVGVSAYQGASGQGNLSRDFGVQILSAHATANHGPWQMRGLYAQASVADAAFLPTPATSEDLRGWYTEVAYQLWSQSREQASLTPFLRVGNLDFSAGDGMPSAQSLIVTGLAWKPQSHVVFKLDVEFQDPAAGPNTQTLAFTLGWSF